MMARPLADPGVTVAKPLLPGKLGAVLTSEGEPLETWAQALREGDVEGAWSDFIDRYRRLIFATIRHYAEDYDDVMDIFAHVCETLRQGELSRLKSFLDQETHRARFSTWLVVVIRNISVDWFRKRDGRKRLSTIVERLTPLQQKIHECLVDKSYTHREAYEILSTNNFHQLTFGSFLREIGATYRAVSGTRKGVVVRELIGINLALDTSAHEVDSAIESDQIKRVGEALDELESEERAALLLFVVEGMPAKDVARFIGWPNAKAVYNRVYRCLANMRDAFEREGIGPGDL